MRFPGRLSYPPAILNLVAGIKTKDSSLWQILDEIVKIKFFDIPVKFISSSYSATAEDDVIIVDATRGAVTITLPAFGQYYNIKKIDATANNVIIKPTGTAKIDGATSKIFNTQYQTVSLLSDGTNWYIISWP